MDWYSLLKFLHIGSAIIWLGGALVMVLLGHAAERGGREQQLVDVVRQVAWCAERVFVPSSSATLVFGLLMAWYGSMWSELWVILGIVGAAVTLALGIGVLSPRAKKIGDATAASTPALLATSREILAIAKFDMVLLFTIVAVMVLKPQPNDVGLLATMAVVILAAAAFFLRRVGRPTVVTAESLT